MQHSATLTMSMSDGDGDGDGDEDGDGDGDGETERPLPTCTGLKLFSCIFVPGNSTSLSGGLGSTTTTSSVVRSTANVVSETPSGSAVVIGLQSKGCMEEIGLMLLCGLVLLGCVGVW